jgi:hypothetical protein
MRSWQSLDWPRISLCFIIVLTIVRDLLVLSVEFSPHSRFPFIQINFSITFPSMSWPPLRFSDQNNVCTSYFSHALYMSCPSKYSWIDYADRISWKWWVISADHSGHMVERMNRLLSLETGFVVSNPTRYIDVCVRLFCVCVVLCVGSGLATGWSPSKESYGLRIVLRN